MTRTLLLLSVVAVTATGFAGCSSQPSTPNLGPGTFAITITSVDGSTTLPTVQSPLPANHGTTTETWEFTVEAHGPTGELDTNFNGYVRPSLEPGTVVGLTSTTNTTSRLNILLQGGRATGVLQGTAIYGPARLWIEDLGYIPVTLGGTAQCSNGVDDNHNGLIDYPADPGCYEADDDTEDGGSYAAGVSPPVQYALPLVSDVRGAIPAAGGGLRGGAATPYKNEAIDIAAGDPEYLVVTCVASDGFFVTDVGAKAAANRYNSLFAFAFATPANIQVCDRITSLSGTANDFYGFTQLSFPSFTNTYVILGQDGGTFDADGGINDCQVPEPTVLVSSSLYSPNSSKDTTAAALYPYEAGLVRVECATIAKNFGPGLAVNQAFGPSTSNCDYNGDGDIDYTCVGLHLPNCEGDCATTCDNDPTCTEWTAYATRNAFKVTPRQCTGPSTCCGMTSEADCTSTPGCAWSAAVGGMIQIDSSTVSTFDPVGSAGLTIPAFTGSLVEFSGGDLNWTVQVRCSDDIVCPAALGCSTQQPIPSAVACVRPRTIDDNDQGSN